MPDRILGPVLRTFEKLYRFPSAQKGSPSEVEMDLPIQVVHDASRLPVFSSAIAPINDGFWIQTGRHAHVAVGGLISTLSIFDNSLPVANGFPATLDKKETAAWYWDSWLMCSDGGDFNYGIDALQHGSATVGRYVSGASLQRRILHYWDDVVNTMGVQDSNERPDRPPYPIRLLTNPNSTVSAFWWIQTAADNAGTNNIDFNALWWLGPIGVGPPGYP